MSWRPGWRTASSLAVALGLAGCGGTSQPKLAHADAAPLIVLAGRVAAGGSCGSIPIIGRRTIALVNRHRVPEALQEPLLSGVNDLSSQAASCTSGPAATVAPELDTSEVGPVPHADGAAQQARNLQAWLSAWSG